MLKPLIALKLEVLVNYGREINSIKLVVIIITVGEVEECLVMDTNTILATMVGMVEVAPDGAVSRSWRDATRQLWIKHIHLYTAC